MQPSGQRCHAGDQAGSYQPGQQPDQQVAGRVAVTTIERHRSEAGMTLRQEIQIRDVTAAQQPRADRTRETMADEILPAVGGYPVPVLQPAERSADVGEDALDGSQTRRAGTGGDADRGNNK